MKRKTTSEFKAFLYILFTCGIGLGAMAGELTYAPAALNASTTLRRLEKRVQAGEHDALPNFWIHIKQNGAPLIEPLEDDSGFSYVTFLWPGDNKTQNVVIFDGVAGFDAKDRMTLLPRTNVWYKTYRVRNDARFAYNLSPNDSLQPISEIKDNGAMKARLAAFQTDPLNPHRCPTTFGAYGTDSSYVQLPHAPPLFWGRSISRSRQGKVISTTVHSDALNEDKKVWIYTPPGFGRSTATYPLLVTFDGDRNVAWIPKILDLLVSSKRIPPTVAVMTDDSVPSLRQTELPCNPKFAHFVAKELVPWMQSQYHASTRPKDTVVAGSSYGGLAAVFAGLQHPDVFGNVISLSGSFWWKPAGEKDAGWLIRQVAVSPKLPLRFYLEVGLMEGYEQQVVNNRRMRDVLRAKKYPAGYEEFDGGHSFLTWSNGIVAGLTGLLPTPK